MVLLSHLGFAVPEMQSGNSPPSVAITTPPDDAMFTAGVAVVTQDCRGRFESEGTDGVFRTENEGSDDTMKWIASQPWSNGLFVTEGASAGAIMGYMFSQGTIDAFVGYRTEGGPNARGKQHLVMGPLRPRLSEQLSDGGTGAPLRVSQRVPAMVGW